MVKWTFIYVTMKDRYFSQIFILRTEGVPERQYEFSLRLFCDCTNVCIWIVFCGKKVYLVKNETYLSRKL